MSNSVEKKFKVGDMVVYPAHGVGQVTAVDTEEVIPGATMQFYVITLEGGRMVLRVPKARATHSGLRHLSSKKEIEMAIDMLRSKPKVGKSAWGKRAQEYEAKINSGDPISTAEVLRDLHKKFDANKKVDEHDLSYSERSLYDDALTRLIDEYSITMSATRAEAMKVILEALGANTEED